MPTHNPDKWSAYTATKAAIFAVGGLKNLATAAISAVSGAIDNTAGDTCADLELLIDLATAATAGGYVSIWFIHALDGTNYEAIESATPARAADVIIPVRSTTTDSQVCFCGPILWPQGKFTVLIQNNTGQTTTNTDSLTQLYYRSYNPGIVTA
jgi:hypothetical protein